MQDLEEKIILANQSIITRREFLDSYSFEVYAQEGVKILDKYDVFDATNSTGEACITYASRKLPAITLLGLYTHFGGSLGVTGFNGEGKESRFFASLGKGKNKQPPPQDYFNQQLGLAFLREKGRNVFSTHGCSFARLLHKLAFSASLEPNHECRNTKAKRGALLPPYLTRLTRDYDKFDSRGQRLALQYIRDILAVYVSRKISTTVAKSTVRINLPSHYEKDSRDAEVKFLTECFVLAYPSLHFSEGNPYLFSGLVHGKLEYQGYFTMTAAQIYEVSLRNPIFPLRSRIISKPAFSFESRPENCRLMDNCIIGNHINNRNFCM